MGMPSFRVAQLVRDRDLLEPARREAFGLDKGGIPNRPVADELVAAGILRSDADEGS